MQSSTIGGVALTMVAGIMSGNCMLPIKFAKRWRWENIWLVFSVMSLLVLPWALAAGLVRDLTGVYRSLGPAPLIRPLLFGAGWGVAQILFGISVRRLGLGVAYAIIVGLGAVLGTLVPLFAGQSTLVKHESLLLILAGVVVMVVGIGLTAWGGQVREHSGRNKPESSAPFAEQGYAAAIAVAVLSGVMAPMLNYAFAFGQSIATEAVRHGSAPVAAAYAVWPIALLGGLLPNVAYCVFLLMRNRSWNGFRSTGRDALWSSLMAVLWMGAFALYGMSAVYLGPLGTSVGWGLFQIFMIMTATLSGLLTAEWHSAPRRALQLLTTGVIGLITATLLLTIGGRQ